MSQLQALPEEVLSLIASLLSREDKKRLRAACRALRPAVNSTVASVIVGDDLELPPVAAFPRLARIQVEPERVTHSAAQLQALAAALEQRPLLTSLSTPGHSSACVQALAAACPRLRDLELQGWAPLGGWPGWLLALLMLCSWRVPPASHAHAAPLLKPALRAFAEDGEAHTLQPLAALASSLTSLKLLHLPSNRFDLDPISRLSQLQHLRLSPSNGPDSSWGNFSYKPLPALVLQRLAGLEHLHVGAGCSIQPADAGALSQLTGLTHLWVYSLRVEGAAAAVLQLPALRELGCAFIGPVQRGPAAAAPLLLPQLTQLQVGQLHQDQDPYEGALEPDFVDPGTDDELAVEAAIEAASDMLSTAGCLAGLLPLPQLLELELTVQDGDWAPLAAELGQQTSLTSLRLAPTDHARRYDNDEWMDLGALLPALQQLAELKQLRLSCGFKLGLPCFQAISGMAQLEVLAIITCDLEDPYLSLLHRCGALAEIDLTGCWFNDDHLVVAMLLPKPGLRRLTVSYDPQQRWERMKHTMLGGSDGEMEGAREVAGFLGVELKLLT